MSRIHLDELESGPIHITGKVVEMAGRRCLQVPVRHSLGPTQGVRLRVSINLGRSKTVTAIALANELVLLSGPGAHRVGDACTVVLSGLPSRGDVSTIPRSLAVAAHENGKTFNGVSEAQLALLVTMVRESSEKMIAVARIEHAVNSLPDADQDELSS